MSFTSMWKLHGFIAATAIIIGIIEYSSSSPPSTYRQEPPSPRLAKPTIADVAAPYDKPTIADVAAPNHCR